MHSVPLVDALGFLDDTRKILNSKMEIPTAGMSGGASLVEYGSPNGRQTQDAADEDGDTEGGTSGGAALVEYGSPDGRQRLPREEGARLESRAVPALGGRERPNNPRPRQFRRHQATCNTTRNHIKSGPNGATRGDKQ